MKIDNIIVKGNSIYSLYFTLYLKYNVKDINVYIDYNETDDSESSVMIFDEVNNFLNNQISIKKISNINYNNKFLLTFGKEVVGNASYSKLKELLISLLNVNKTIVFDKENTYIVNFVDEPNFNTRISPVLKNNYNISSIINGTTKNNNIIKENNYYYYENSFDDKIHIGICFNKNEITIDDACNKLYKKYNISYHYNNEIYNLYDNNPCSLESLSIQPLSKYIEPIADISFYINHLITKMFCELLKQKEFIIDFDFCYFYNKNYQLLIDNQIIFTESFYCLENENDNFTWYLKKLNTFGWPAFFKNEIKNIIFNGFNKEKYLDAIDIKIFDLKDYIIIKDSL